MIDREKVLKGLECCFGSIGKACPMECPYRVECLMQDDEYNMYSVMHDALKLLKEQQKQRFFVDFDGKITPLPIQKHGNWIPIKTPTGVEYGGVKEYTVSEVMCSECGFTDDVSASIYTYCPECGVKMDKEEKQDDCNNPDKFASEGGA